MTTVKRGDIFWADLPMFDCVQGGIRPVLVMQNDIGNKYSPTTIIVPLTSEIKKESLPTHMIVMPEDAPGLEINSMALCEQILTIDKRKIKNRIGKVKNDRLMKDISRACAISLGF